MKQPKSTRNKNEPPRLDFKGSAETEGKGSPKRKMTEDQAKFGGPKLAKPTPQKDEEKLEISSEDSMDGRESSGNTFGFMPMNNLMKSNKGVKKKQEKETLNKVVSTDSKANRTKKSQFKIDETKLKASKSIVNNSKLKSLGFDKKKKDIMNVAGSDNSWTIAQEWQNDKNLDAFQNADAISKKGKKSKNSKIGSRDGSRKGKRIRNALGSVQSRRDRTNRSKYDRKRAIQNSKSLVVFNEFKTEELVDNEIGLYSRNLRKEKAEAINFDPQQIEFDESHLDEAVSFNYSLADRSYSYENNDNSLLEGKDNIGEEQFVEIIDQDSFEKLASYKDRLPCLTIRKMVLRLRLVVTKSAYSIISHPFFEYCSLVVIIANSIVLALEDPTDPESGNTGFLATLDTVFLTLYSIEMVLKIMGLGFVLNKGAYLRDSWNILDFVIVTSAYVQLLLSSGANLSVLRSFRVLRPLRTISGIEGLRVIVSALMKAVTLLVDTVIILIFFFIIFAIAGVQLWTGILKRRCINEETGVPHPNDGICGSVSCPSGYFCGKTNDNPNYGVTSFDNFFYALIVVFQSVTLEGWSVIMVYVQRAFNVLSLFFFIPLVFIGAFFLLNLTLVVIKAKFTEEHEANKERKKKRNFKIKKLTDKDKENLKYAKEVFKRVKVKNRKVYATKVHRRDSDDSKAESRHRKNLKKVNREESLLFNNNPKQDSRTAAAKSANTIVNMLRPLHAISGLKGKKQNTAGDPITEEMSHSELSLMNQKQNIFYPQSLNGKGDNNTDSTKERNILFLDKGKGKLKMEGMYGISRRHGDNENKDLGSNSDLLEDIPYSDDGNPYNDDENIVEKADSDILFPLDSSFSDGSPKGAKKHSESKTKAENGNDKNGDIMSDKQSFCISEGSCNLEDDSPNLSPDKQLKNVERKNTNYFTATNPNQSSIDNTDLKIYKKSGSKIDPLKLFLGKSTKISSRIEGNNAIQKENETATAKNFNYKNILLAHLKKKKEDDEKNGVKEFDSEAEGDEETEEKKGANKSKEIIERDIEDMEADEIEVVKRGKKIRVKRETKFDDNKNTAFEEILLKHDELDTPRAEIKKQDKKPPKTTIKPYLLRRHFELNDIILEGKIDVEEEENPDSNENEEAKKAEEMRNFKPGDKIAEVEKDEDEEPNKAYLEKFNYFYRSNVIATGTISIVSTVKNSKEIINIPNPCAEIHGAIIVDDECSTVEEEEEQKSRVEDTKRMAIRRNDTLLPGGLMRQNTSVSKTLAKKSKTARKFLMNKNTMKKKVRDEEEYSEENVLKRLILDVPESSPFYKKIDVAKFKKEQEVDDKLEEGEEDQEDQEQYDESEDEVGQIEDIFLDRDINFDVEIDRACKACAKRKNDKTEWSGQDIKIDFDPYYAKIAVGSLGSSMVYPYGFFGLYMKLKGYVKTFVLSSFFENLMTLAVAINTMVLALDRHGISETDEYYLTQMNFYFTMIFISEMGFKLIGLGPIGYLLDKMNYLDGMVVLLSIFELAFLSGGGALSAFRAVRIMRTFRVLRVARLLKSMQSMQTIIDVITRSISSFLYLALLLLLFIFIYALLGMQTFGGRFNFDEGIPRSNFDTFNASFITVFQVLTMENWQFVLYDCMRSSANQVVTCVYLISWIFLGNFMLLNLFLAILLDSFAEEDEADLQKKKSPEEIKQDEIEAKNEFYSRTGEQLILDYTDIAMSNSKNNKSKAGGFVKQTKKKLKNDKLMDESFELEEVAIKKQKTEIKEKKPDFWGVECRRSFFLFSYRNIFRRICYKMTNHPLFENVVLILIVLSSFKLVYDTYILEFPDDSAEKQISTNIDTFFTIFFLFEAVVKCISLGFVQDNGSYLRESWNQLDFFIVCASIFDLAFDGVDIPAIRILRLLRTLRPLRFISHNSDMKLIVTALLESIGHIINVVVVVLMVWLMFAILAVNLFGGKLYYCDIDTYIVDNKAE